jgi:hypothetical protein
MDGKQKSAYSGGRHVFHNHMTYFKLDFEDGFYYSIFFPELPVEQKLTPYINNSIIWTSRIRLSESCQVNMIYSGSVVFLRRFLNDPYPFSHFCDYFPFEEDLALYVNNFEFPLPKVDLYQV